MKLSGLSAFIKAQVSRFLFHLRRYLHPISSNDLFDFFLLIFASLR